MTTIFMRWTLPAATALALPQCPGLVLARAPDYTPIELLGNVVGQELETFQPSFALAARIFQRGQRRRTVPLILHRAYRNYAEAEEHKAKHETEMPPSTVAFSLYVNAQQGQSISSYGYLGCGLRSMEPELKGRVIRWHYVFEAGTVEVPATTSYTASMLGTMRLFNS